MDIDSHTITMMEEHMIQQVLIGLHIMPHRLTEIEAQAARGDRIAREIVRRWKART